MSVNVIENLNTTLVSVRDTVEARHLVDHAYLNTTLVSVRVLRLYTFQLYSSI